LPLPSRTHGPRSKRHRGHTALRPGLGAPPRPARQGRRRRAHRARDRVMASRGARRPARGRL